MKRCLRCRKLHEGVNCPACFPKGQERGGRPWRRVRDFVLDRDGHRCTQCNRPCPHPKHHHVDHIKARIAGGSDDPSNLRTLCAGANTGSGMCKDGSA